MSIPPTLESVDLETAKRMCRNLPVRPLCRKGTNVPYAWEANAGNLRDPVNGVYRKHRGTFNWSEWGSAQAALDGANAWIGEMKGVIKTERNAVIEIPVAIRSRLMYYVERCNEKGYALDDVFRLGLERLEADRLVSDITFAEAAERTIAQKRRENKSAKYIQDLRDISRSFGKAFGERKFGEISAEDIEEWLEAKEVSPVTWNNYRRNLGIFWGWGLNPRNNWVRTNVTAHVAIQAARDEAVTALRPIQAKTLLATAYREIPRLVPYLVLTMFVGLRRSEAQAARWEDINWETRTIEVRGGKMRSVTSRFPNLEPVAIDWLKPLAQESGEICSGTFARRADVARLRALTFPFDGNIFRHSFGSCHYHAYKNPNATTVEMGHTSVKMLHKHYRRPVPQSVALEYFGLTRAIVLGSESMKDGAAAQTEHPAQLADQPRSER